MADELPILVAQVTVELARALADAARAGKNVWVPLKWPPGASGLHVLELYTPASREPVRLFAEPLGPSGDKGYALKLVTPPPPPTPTPRHDEDDDEQTIARSATPADPFVGRSLAGGRFEILAALGEGSIGAVYRARHTGLGITVAVKVLHEAFQRDREFCRRFEAEALALSHLDHANLVHVHDYGQEPDGLLYIAMAFVDGTTLRSLQGHVPDQKFELRRAVSLMLQVSAGLGHAHGRGLIHRDVKPDNVMIVAKEDDDGNRVENVKLLDFGFAIPPASSADVAQRLAGTPVYMSPEQCLGEELDGRSDIYACGVMLHELMAGTVPFLSHSPEAIHRMHIERPPPRIADRRPDVDSRMERLVQKALAKSRDARHKSMQEFRAELKQLLAPEGASVSLSVPPSAPGQSPPAPAVAAALEGALTAGSMDWFESRLRDGKVLRAVAEQALGSEATKAFAAEVLGRAGVAGAHALSGVRSAIAAPDGRTRTTFVTTMKSLGETALPVLRAALEQLVATAETKRRTAELAEDLLLAVPPIADEVAGHLVVKFAASPVPSVCRAATRALPRVWGSRARPVLATLLDHGDDGVRIAALAGLREVGCIDLEVVAKLASLFKAQSQSAQLRAASMGALHAAQPGAKAAATALLDVLARG